MIRDIKKRILEFATDGDEEYPEYDIDFDIIPIALTREQIDEYNPPPNPAKMTDPRANKFVDANGYQSWEVDALKPQVLNRILEENIKELIDIDIYNHILEREKEDIIKLSEIQDSFNNN